jgi:hypothetical protein
MSTGLQLAREATMVLAAGGDGLIDWGNTKVNELGGLLRAFSVVAGIGFVIFQAIVSRGAMARIIISGLAAAVFIWIVWNVTDLSDRVSNEVNSAPAAQLHQTLASYAADRPAQLGVPGLRGTA